VLWLFSLVTVAALLLVAALITYDFSIAYVARNTLRGTPLYYRVTALWGSLEGSLLLWQWLLSVFSAAMVLSQRHKLRELMPYAVAVLLTVSAFFLFIMVVPANPFRSQFPVPTDGRGLNPLLLTTSMIFHPVFLYLGFVGFTIPFAFAIGALISGRFGEEWIVATRRWTIMAWYFLTVGVLIGGWWAYTTLGWGGYWAWDRWRTHHSCPGCGTRFALGDDPGISQDAENLESVPDHHDVCHDHVWHLSDPQRHHLLGACLLKLFAGGLFPDVHRLAVAVLFRGTGVSPR
jgi:hypothetical protein